MNYVKSSQKHGGKDTNNLVNFCHPPLNCVNKPKCVHRTRDSSQKRGWNGQKEKRPPGLQQKSRRTDEDTRGRHTLYVVTTL